MKKIIMRIMVIFLAFLFVFSCKKDEFTESDALKAQKDLLNYQDSIEQVRDSLNHLGGIIQYSVSVVPVNGSGSFLKSAHSTSGLNNAIVSVSQFGKVMVDTTGDSGIAVFYDLRVGTVSVNVRTTDYTSIDFIAEILPENDPNVNVYYNVLRYAATMVPVFSLTEGTSTIKGQLTYESDLTNFAPEPADSIDVIAMIDVDDATFISNYFNQLNGSSLGKYNAEIVQVAFTDLVAYSTTDANGNYSIEMPSTSDGLPIKLEVDDVAVDQQLLMNTVNGQKVTGVQSIRTIFNSNLTSGTASTVPTVPAAFVVFGDPTGTVAQQPDKAATANAVISESGIASIVINNQGDGYTQAPIVKITGDGEGAEAVAFISDGKVTSITITNPGHGYTNAGLTVTITDKEGSNATAVPAFTYSITSYTMSNFGSGYKSVPQVTVNSSTGTGASAMAVMSGYIDEIKVTDQGSDYTCPPNVIISGSTGTDATATAVMTTYNPVHSIELTDNFTTTYSATPSVQINTISTGSGATAIAQLATSGTIGEINLTDAGLGYTQAPAVLVVGGGGHGATAYATLNGDGSINIFILTDGEGYTSDPTIQISAPPAGGTQAVATAVRYFAIDKLVLTNPGSGYNISFVNGGFPDEYNTEPNVIIDGITLGDADVIVRPNMKVESLNISNYGTDYTAAPGISFVPSCGFGSGAAATSSILYSVKKLDVVTEGSGYSYDANVVVTIVTPVDGCETQAIANAVKSKGVLASLEITNGGEGYLAPPHITISSPSTPTTEAKVTAVVSGGAVTGYTITNEGEGYPYSAPGNFSATVSTHTIAANLSATAFPESGKISFVTITDPGYGYSTIPLVSFVRVDQFGNKIISHDFIDAVATAVLEDGRVTSIEITNPGTGYYYKPNVEIYIPTYSQTALGTPNIDALGHITGVTFTDNGQGYVSAPTITFSPSVPGYGQGATAEAILTNGQITGVKMTNMGNGYLGKNYPSVKGVSFLPTGSALTTFSVYASKTYIRDIYLGTGKRTIEN